jgi:hypothetical protein
MSAENENEDNELTPHDRFVLVTILQAYLREQLKKIKLYEESGTSERVEARNLAKHIEQVRSISTKIAGLKPPPT